jgi:hypothetical protein
MYRRYCKLSVKSNLPTVQRGVKQAPGSVASGLTLSLYWQSQAFIFSLVRLDRATLPRSELLSRYISLGIPLLLQHPSQGEASGRGCPKLLELYVFISLFTYIYYIFNIPVRILTCCCVQFFYNLANHSKPIGNNMSHIL